MDTLAMHLKWKKELPTINQHTYGGFDHLSSPQYPNITINQTFAILQ
jgi:hypothetical protein